MVNKGVNVNVDDDVDVELVFEFANWQQHSNSTSTKTGVMAWLLLQRVFMSNWLSVSSSHAQCE